MHRNYYVHLRHSFYALNLKFVTGRGYDTFKGKEKKTEQKVDSNVFTETRTDDKEEK